MSAVSANPSPPQGPPLFLSSPIAGQSSSGAGHGGSSGSRAGRRLLPQGPRTQSPLAPCSPVSGAGAGAGPSWGCRQAGLYALRPLVRALRLGCGARTEQGAREGRAQLRPPLPVPPREGQKPGPGRCAVGSRGAAPGSWRGHFVLPQGGWAWAWLWEGGGDGGSRDHDVLGAVHGAPAELLGEALAMASWPLKHWLGAGAGGALLCCPRPSMSPAHSCVERGAGGLPPSSETTHLGRPKGLGVTPRPRF